MARLLLKNLTPGTNYKIQLRAVEGDSVSEWSRLFNLSTSTDTIAPDVPAWAASDEWIVNGDTFVATWQALNFTLDQNKDFDHYEIELDDTVTQTVIRTNNTSHTLTFDQNRIIFGTAKATVKARIRSVDAVGNVSAWSVQKTATNPAPAAPASITVTSLYDSVLIEWAAVADIDLDHYLVQVSTTGVGGTYTTVYTGVETTFTHATIAFATDHFYKVFAVDKFGSTSSATTSGAVRPKSTFALDTTPPNNATNLVATPGFDGTRQSAFADLTWTASTSTDVSEYIIRYSTDGSSWQYVKVNPDVAALRVDDLTPDNSYYFGIRTVDTSGNLTTWLNATVYPITTTEDTTAPSQPAAPTVASAVQRIQVTHTGLKQAGGNLEADLDTFQVFASTTSGFTPGTTNMLGTMKWNGVNAIQTFDVPASGSAGATTETWYVVVKAVDRSGNISTASPEATSTPGLVGNLNITELQADRITAGTGLINNLTVKSTLQIGDASTNGIIQSYDYVNSGGTSGFYMDKDELIIKSGSIEASALKLQNSPNLIAAQYASFEFAPTTYDDVTIIARDAGATVTIDSAIFKYGEQALKIVTDGSGAKDVFLGEDSITNIVIPEDGDYIVSYWARSTTTPTVTLLVATASNTSNVVTTFDSSSQPIGTANTWARFQRVVTLNEASIQSGKTEIGFTIPASTTVYIDGVQIEKRTGATTTASVWKAPGLTNIDGGAITTGTIRSNTTLDVNGVILPTWAIGVDGAAQFGNLLIRGNTVVGTDSAEGALSFIQSYDYQTGLSGWIIRSDGFAEFRNLSSDSITIDSLGSGNLSGQIELLGSLIAFGALGEQVGMSAEGFISTGPVEVEVTNKALTSNVATLTTVVAHGFAVGSPVVVEGVDSTFDGSFTITAVTSTTFSYALTASDVTSVADTGIAKSRDFTGSNTGPVFINFPTDGTQPNIISGTLTADTLTVTSGATFRGTSGIESGAILEINGTVLEPKNVPSVSIDYNIKNLAGTGTPNGITKGHNDNIFASTGQDVFEFSASDGSLVSNPLVAPNATGFFGVYYSSFYSRYYVFGNNTVFDVGGSTYNIWIKVYNTSWTLQSTFTIFSGNPNSAPWDAACLGYDHNNNQVMVAYQTSVSSPVNIKVQRYTMNGSGVPTGADGGAITLASTSASKDPAGILFGTFDISANGFVYRDKFTANITAKKNVLVFDSSGNYVANDSWPNNYANSGGMYWNGTVSKFYDVTQDWRLREYQGGNSYWTSGAATAASRWLAYTWYDGTGTTHETMLGARTKFTLTKRARMKVTIAAIPNMGQTDDPDRARVYMASQDADPGASGSAWNLRSTIVYPSTSTTIDPYSSTTTDPPTTNGFLTVAGIGQIKTPSGSSFWKGDDTAQFYQLVVTSNADASASAGNKPALRVGDTAGVHLRIDGNEVIAMSGDSTQGNLVLNAGGLTVAATNSGSFKIGGSGTTVLQVRYGQNVLTASGGVGADTVTHGGGSTPSYVLVVPRDQNGSTSLTVSSLSSTTFTVTMRRQDGNANAGVYVANGGTRTVDWMAVWV